MKPLLRLALVLMLSAAGLHAQSWTVKPAWVRAHEEFLSSDVMAGRGSATRDEQIAATYVASQFMGYGLKTAPGMTGYLQAAEVQTSDLDGNATLTAGGLALREGQDFHLLLSSGLALSGPLTPLSASQLEERMRLARAGQAGAPLAAGAFVLAAHLPSGMQATMVTRLLRGSGAAGLVVVEDESTRAYTASSNGHTRTPIMLKGLPPGRSAMSVLAVSREAMDKLEHAAAGATASLTVHSLVPAAPRATYNAIGWLPGTDAAAGTVLLTAHLDHLGIARPVAGDAIYNGANDDAAGTTAVLEMAHALAGGPPLRRSVLFVCYGSEEIGELGSTYFGEHTPVPLTSLVANLEFEMIGNQDPKMPAGVLLLTGWERSNLGPALKAHGALLGPDPYPEQHFFERSDNYALALKGVVAHTAAGWGTPPTYHQPSDDMAHLDLAFMTRAIQSLVEPVRWLASSDFKPAWNAGGQPTGR